MRHHLCKDWLSALQLPSSTPTSGDDGYYTGSGGIIDGQRYVDQYPHMLSVAPDGTVTVVSKGGVKFMAPGVTMVKTKAEYHLSFAGKTINLGKICDRVCAHDNYVVVLVKSDVRGRRMVRVFDLYTAEVRSEFEVIGYHDTSFTGNYILSKNKSSGTVYDHAGRVVNSYTFPKRSNSLTVTIDGSICSGGLVVPIDGEITYEGQVLKDYVVDEAKIRVFDDRAEWLRQTLKDREAALDKLRNEIAEEEAKVKQNVDNEKKRKLDEVEKLQAHAKRHRR